MILSGKMMAGVGVLVALLVSGLAWQTWQLDRATRGEARANTLLDTCRALNAESNATIEAINLRAEAAERDAREQREAAANAARRWRESQDEQTERVAELERRLDSEIQNTDFALCAVPAGVERLFRERAVNPHR